MTLSTETEILFGASGKKNLSVFTCVFSHEIEYYQSWKMQIKLKAEKIAFGIIVPRSSRVFA